VYAADEFYLSAGRPLPPATEYDGYPQYENGIGMVRAFLDELQASAEDRKGALRGALADGGSRVVEGVDSRPFAAVTGTLFAPVLTEALRAAGLDVRVRVLAVENRLFGGNVGVAGLLGGNDVALAIAADGRRATYLVPDVVVNSDGLLLDDVPADELSARSRADVRVIAGNAASLVDAVRVKG
jgi:NifB/MoaA-like Fe-S oxidoreductase